MAYSSDLANLTATQLRRFAALNRHQLAGHAANLDFWLAEARHGLDVLDGYWPRFHRMKAVQADDDRPRPVPDAELAEARKALGDAAYRFLLRCFHEALIDEPALRRACHGLGIGVEMTDLKRR